MRLKRESILIAGLLAAVSASMAVAQSHGGGTTGGPPSNPNAEATSGVGKYAHWDQTLSQQHGSMYFMGKVTVAGGMLPWDPIPVTVNCKGTPKYNTVTDPKGGFRIEAAERNSEVVTVKDDKSHATPAALVGCEVTAQLDGFLSSKLTIINGSILDNPDIGTITLRPDEKSVASSISTTTASAPKDALKEFEKARADDAKKNAEGARKDLEKAVKIDPQFAEAWYHLGRLQEAEHPQDARVSYQKAIAADPKYSAPYEHLAGVAAIAKDWHAVINATDQAMKLNPAGTPQILYYSALGNYNAAEPEIAEERARASLAMDPSHLAPNTEQLLAVMLAGRGQYAEAVAHLRNSLSYSPPGPNADLMKQQIAQLEKLVPADAKK